MPEGPQRPLVTFALFAYRQAHCIEAALQGAFAQTYSPLEIILSDDGSDDATYALMERAAAQYTGPHRIVLNRNPRNLGIGEHVNTVARLAGGELLVFAAGDDVSVPQRVEIIVERWLAEGRPEALICSDFLSVDAAGRELCIASPAPPGPFLLEKMSRGDIGVKGATAAATMRLFRSFPPIDPAVRCEDRVLPFRALLLGGRVIFIAQQLVRYCTEGGISERKARRGKDYLLRDAPARLAMIIPDAVQRLADLKATAPERSALIKIAALTILDHESGIDLPQQRGIGLERRTVFWAAKGARLAALLKLYCKLRFIGITVLYQRLRYPDR